MLLSLILNGKKKFIFFFEGDKKNRFCLWNVSLIFLFWAVLKFHVFWAFVGPL